MNSTPQLLILNQMAGPMTWELAVDLARQIEGVELLTGHPDTLAKEAREGLRMYAAPPYRRGGNRTRVASWLRYMFRAAFWLWRQPADVPVLLFSNPPILVWLGWLFWKWRGTRYAVMVHDIYPDVVIQMAGCRDDRWFIRIWRGLNRRAYQRADIVLALGERMAAVLGRQFDASQTRARRIEVIPPWADNERLGPRDKHENWFAIQHHQVDKLTIMYSGNMGRGHDVESLLAAARALQDVPQLHFMFVGDGPKWQLLESALRDQPAPNATLLGWQSEEALPYSLATADVAYVSLEKELSGLAIPSKAFYFLAAGTPLIASCLPESELAETIDRFGCGCVIEPGQPQALIDILKQMMETPELLARWRAGARAAGEHYARTAGTDAFLAVLRRHGFIPQGDVATEIGTTRVRESRAKSPTGI